MNFSCLTGLGPPPPQNSLLCPPTSIYIVFYFVSVPAPAPSCSTMWKPTLILLFVVSNISSSQNSSPWPQSQRTSGKPCRKGKKNHTKLGKNEKKEAKI